MLAGLALAWPGSSAARAKLGQTAKAAKAGKASKASKANETDIVAESWRAPAIPREDLAGMMQLSLESSLKELRPEKAARLRADLDRLARRTIAERISYGTHASAMLEALGFRYEARAYADWTVLQSPENPVALANVSALSCYPPLVRLATEIAPRSPVVHTNTGSCAMAARQWDIAKASYERALEHRNALIGLGRWYLRVRDVKTAMEYLVQANGVHFHPQLEKRDQKGKLFPPRPRSSSERRRA